MQIINNEEGDNRVFMTSKIGGFMLHCTMVMVATIEATVTGSLSLTL